MVEMLLLVCALVAGEPSDKCVVVSLGAERARIEKCEALVPSRIEKVTREVPGTYVKASKCVYLGEPT